MLNPPDRASVDFPRAVLVTGAGRRMGSAFAADLAAHGAAVAVHCNRSAAEAQSVVDDIRQRGGSACVVRADFSDRQAVENLVGEAASALGRPLDLLINNASLFEDDDIDSFDWAAWDRHFAVHVDAPVMLSRKFAEQLEDGGEGLIVNLVDQRVLKPTPRFFSYALSKSALWHATRMMAQALAPRVRVNAIGPGPTLRSDRQTEDDFAAQAGALLLRRGPELTEIAATVRYLWQAKSVTGQMIAVDGGQHLAWQTPDATVDE